MNICARFCHLRASYVRVRARIIMNGNSMVDTYINSLSFKFDEDPSIGWWEIAEIKPPMHIYRF